jgi:glycosyltransferase involved in cell wall biosynthesis
MPSPAARPRLMFVVGMTPTKIGGVEKFLRALVLDLDAHGYDSILCFDGDISSEFAEYFSFPFVTLEVLRHQEGLGLGARAHLWTLLRKHRPEIFVYAFHSVMRVFPWLAKLAGSKRVFFNDHSSRAQGVVPAPLALHKRLIGRFLTSPVNAIISVADFTRRSSTAFGLTGALNVVVTNGIEIKPLEPEKGSLLRRKYGIAAEAVVITQVCWMVQVKGVDVLLRSAQDILKRDPSVRFLFVGGGVSLPEYKALAEQMGLTSSTIFTDIISDPVGAGVLDATDIYCQPSRWQEACPLAVLEAMSKKLPVVASRTGGLPELIADQKTGFLVPVEDDAQLAAALDTLIENEAMRHAMGEAGYESVMATHRIETMVGLYVRIFLQGPAATDR